MSPKYTVLNIKLVNIITIMVINFNDGLGALYGTLTLNLLTTTIVAPASNASK